MAKNAVEFLRPNGLHQVFSETGGFAPLDITGVAEAAHGYGANRAGSAQLVQQVPTGAIRKGDIAEEDVERVAMGELERGFHVFRTLHTIPLERQQPGDRLERCGVVFNDENAGGIGAPAITASTATASTHEVEHEARPIFANANRLMNAWCLAIIGADRMLIDDAADRHADHLRGKIAEHGRGLIIGGDHHTVSVEQDCLGG